MAKRNSKTSMPGVRVFSFSIAGVLGLLLVSTTMPPIIGGSTDRALIDAPVQLVTSPIQGVVAGLSAKSGETVTAGQQIAVVENNDVDRSKLIELQLQATKIDSDISDHRQTVSEVKQAIKGLQRQIDDQHKALADQFRQQIDGAKAAFDKSKAAKVIAQDSYSIDKTLRRKGVRGGDATKASNNVNIATSATQMARSDLSTAHQRLTASQNGVFLGPNTDTINTMLRELRDNGTKLDNLKIELSSLKLHKTSVDKIRDTEKRRVAQLSHRRIEASAGGELLNLNAQNGNAVSNGDTLATSVDCKNTFVVAIFSEHQASDLAEGAGVTIRGQGWAKPVKGKIDKLVPRATASQNNNFAVPFPPTERRELYAYISLPEQSRVVGKGTCSVGKWVSVSLDDSLVPSSGDLERMASNAGSAAYAGASTLFAKASEALPRLTAMVGSGASQAIPSEAFGSSPLTTGSIPSQATGHGKAGKLSRSTPRAPRLIQRETARSHAMPAPIDQAD